VSGVFIFFHLLLDYAENSVVDVFMTFVTCY